jgi:uncharacterized protein
LLKRHPVFWFFLFAFLISWMGMLPLMLYGRGSFPFTSPVFNIVGGLGPTIAAVIVALALKGKAGLKELFWPLLWGRVGIQWYLVAFLGMVLLAGTGLVLLFLFNGTAPNWARFGPLIGIVPIFLLNLVSNVWEEIGWRGFALPRLQARYSALVASLILGALWAAWHLPLLLNPANPMSAFPWFATLINITATAIIYTWIYNNTRGSLLLVTLFHAASNMVAFALSAVLTPEEFGLHYQYLTVTIVAAAILVTLIYGSKALSRKPGTPFVIND